MCELVTVVCAQCTSPFGISQEFYRRRRADHRSFRCPNSCWNFFPLKKALDAEKESLRNQVRSLSAQVTHLADQLEAAARPVSPEEEEEQENLVREIRHEE